MRKSLLSLALGALFGAGLVLSGMTDPNKIRAFLHFEDATLAVVMASAVGTCALLYAVARRRGSVALAEKKPLDRRVLVGAAVFGVGWGLVGACPGPAIVSIGAGAGWAIVFVVGMIAGARLEAFAPAPSRVSTRRI